MEMTFQNAPIILLLSNLFLTHFYVIYRWNVAQIVDTINFAESWKQVEV